MSYLICGKCKSYYKLQSDESAKDFVDNCDCGGKLRYVENLDIVDPNWKQITIQKKPPKKEIIRNKIHSAFSFGNLNLKYRLIRLWNNFRNRFQTPHNWDNHNRNNNYHTNYGMGAGLINSIRNELNFHNIRWTIVIPVVIAITLLLTLTQGIFTLLTFILLIAVGYLFTDQLIGTKNAIIAGAISFFLGSLLIGSFLLLIPFTILGAINGAVCGWIGGYLKTIRTQRPS
jgi:hypothetical protein